MSTQVFCGLDWATQTHAVCIIDTAGQVLERFEVSHDHDGLAALAHRLARYGANLRIAIERPSGLIVDALVEAAHQVFAIHPNAVKASRPRYRSHGAKSDASDAICLPICCAPMDIAGPRCPHSRTPSALCVPWCALAMIWWPLASLWPINCTPHSTPSGLAAPASLQPWTRPSAWRSSKRYPSPASAAGLNESRLQRFCRAQHYSGRRSPAELLGRLQAAARGMAPALTAQAMADVVLSLVDVLTPLVEQIAALTHRIERFIESLPDGQIIMSFPRAGHICAAQILAELGDVRERFPSDDRLAAEAGVVPVTYQSGKTRCVSFRWACNHRLRKAITCMADNSRHTNLWARGLYAAARQRGCDHPHAIRILARAWLRVLWRAWTDRKTYDASLHLSALKATSSGGG